MLCYEVDFYICIYMYLNILCYVTPFCRFILGKNVFTNITLTEQRDRIPTEVNSLNRRICVIEIFKTSENVFSC